MVLKYQSIWFILYPPSVFFFCCLSLNSVLFSLNGFFSILMMSSLFYIFLRKIFVVDFQVMGLKFLILALMNVLNNSLIFYRGNFLFHRKWHQFSFFKCEHLLVFLRYSSPIIFSRTLHRIFIVKNRGNKKNITMFFFS